MDEKNREFKKARTVRTDYARDVDDIQNWIKKAELKIQDRSTEPHALNEYLQEIQSEMSSVLDRYEKLVKNGKIIIGQTRNDEEKAIVQTTLDNINEQLQQLRSLLDEKKQQVGETLDAWQRFLALYQAVLTWVEEKKVFLQESLHISTLHEARQKLHDYSNAAKTCKVASKNLSEMAKELDYISSVTSVGDLPQKMEHAEEAKTGVEAKILERNALLQETAEEWEQCEKKMKDVRNWMEKSRNSLESPQNKKRPLRDQHAIREKMLGDISIQKAKIAISVEKLELHFRSGIGGDSKVTQAAEDLMDELDVFLELVRNQTHQLEKAFVQVEQYQMEVQQLRQQIVQLEQQLRTVLAPTYLPHDREQAVRDQQAQAESYRRQIDIILVKIRELDPNYVLPILSEPASLGVTYADITAGRSSPCPFDRPPSEEREFVKMTSTFVPETPVKISIQPELTFTEYESEIKTIVVDTAEKAKTNRRGRSPRRREDVQPEPETLSAFKHVVSKPDLKPDEKPRGRSPSPMWAPGSTTYSDVLRGLYRDNETIEPAQSDYQHFEYVTSGQQVSISREESQEPSARHLQPSSAETMPSQQRPKSQNDKTKEELVNRIEEAQTSSQITGHLGEPTVELVGGDKTIDVIPKDLVVSSLAENGDFPNTDKQKRKKKVKKAKKDVQPLTEITFDQTLNPSEPKSTTLSEKVKMGKKENTPDENQTEVTTKASSKKRSKGKTKQTISTDVIVRKSESPPKTHKIILITHEEVRLTPVLTVKMALPEQAVEEHDVIISEPHSLESDSGVNLTDTTSEEIELEQIIFGSVKERPSMRNFPSSHVVEGEQNRITLENMTTQTSKLEVESVTKMDSESEVDMKPNDDVSKIGETVMEIKAQKKKGKKHAQVDPNEVGIATPNPESSHRKKKNRKLPVAGEGSVVIEVSSSSAFETSTSKKSLDTIKTDECENKDQMPPSQNNESETTHALGTRKKKTKKHSPSRSETEISSPPNENVDEIVTSSVQTTSKKKKKKLPSDAAVIDPSAASMPDTGLMHEIRKKNGKKSPRTDPLKADESVVIETETVVTPPLESVKQKPKKTPQSDDKEPETAKKKNKKLESSDMPKGDQGVAVVESQVAPESGKKKKKSKKQNLESTQISDAPKPEERKAKRVKSVSFEEVPQIINAETKSTDSAVTFSEEADNVAVPHKGLSDSWMDTEIMLSDDEEEVRSSAIKIIEPWPEDSMRELGDRKVEYKGLPLDNTSDLWMDSEIVISDEEDVSPPEEAQIMTIAQAPNPPSDPILVQEVLDEEGLVEVITTTEQPKTLHTEGDYKGLPLDDTSDLWMDSEIVISDEEDVSPPGESQIMTTPPSDPIHVQEDRQTLLDEESQSACEGLIEVITRSSPKITEETIIIKSQMEVTTELEKTPPIEEEKVEYKGLPLDNSSDLWMDSEIVLSDEEILEQPKESQPLYCPSSPLLEEYEIVEHADIATLTETHLTTDASAQTKEYVPKEMNFRDFDFELKSSAQQAPVVVEHYYELMPNYNSCIFRDVERKRCEDLVKNESQLSAHDVPLDIQPLYLSKVDLTQPTSELEESQTVTVNDTEEPEPLSEKELAMLGLRSEVSHHNPIRFYEAEMVWELSKVRKVATQAHDEFEVVAPAGNETEKPFHSNLNPYAKVFVPGGHSQYPIVPDVKWEIGEKLSPNWEESNLIAPMEEMPTPQEKPELQSTAWQEVQVGDAKERSPQEEVYQFPPHRANYDFNESIEIPPDHDSYRWVDSMLEEATDELITEVQLDVKKQKRHHKSKSPRRKSKEVADDTPGDNEVTYDIDVRFSKDTIEPVPIMKSYADIAATDRAPILPEPQVTPIVKEPIQIRVEVVEEKRSQHHVPILDSEGFTEYHSRRDIRSRSRSRAKSESEGVNEPLEVPPKTSSDDEDIPADLEVPTKQKKRSRSKRKPKSDVPIEDASPVDLAEVPDNREESPVDTLQVPKKHKRKRSRSGKKSVKDPVEETENRDQTLLVEEILQTGYAHGPKEEQTVEIGALTPTQGETAETEEQGEKIVSCVIAEDESEQILNPSHEIHSDFEVQSEPPIKQNRSKNKDEKQYEVLFTIHVTGKSTNENQLESKSEGSSVIDIPELSETINSTVSATHVVPTVNVSDYVVEHTKQIDSASDIESMVVQIDSSRELSKKQRAVKKKNPEHSTVPLVSQIEDNVEKASEEEKQIPIEDPHLAKPDKPKKKRSRSRRKDQNGTEASTQLEGVAVEEVNRVTYANIAATKKLETPQFENEISQPAPAAQQVQIRSELVTKINESLPVDSDGFMEVVGRKQRRSRSRSSNKSDPETPVNVQQPDISRAPDVPKRSRSRRKKPVDAPNEESVSNPLESNSETSVCDIKQNITHEDTEVESDRKPSRPRRKKEQSAQPDYLEIIDHLPHVENEEIEIRVHEPTPEDQQADLLPTKTPRKKRSRSRRKKEKAEDEGAPDELHVEVTDADPIKEPSEEHNQVQQLPKTRQKVREEQCVKDDTLVAEIDETATKMLVDEQFSQITEVSEETLAENVTQEPESPTDQNKGLISSAPTAVENNSHFTYAEAAASQKCVKPVREEAIVHHTYQREPIQIRIEVVSEPIVHHAPIPTDSEGFTEFLNKKERRSRSRSRSKCETVEQQMATTEALQNEEHVVPKNDIEHEEEKEVSTTYHDVQNDENVRADEDEKKSKKKKKKRNKSKESSQKSGLIGMLTSVKNALKKHSPEEVDTQPPTKVNTSVETLMQPLELSKNSSTLMATDLENFLLMERSISLPDHSTNLPEKRSSFFGNLISKVTGSKHDTPVEKKKRKKLKSTSDTDEEKGVLETIRAKVAGALRRKSETPPLDQNQNLKGDGPFWLDKHVYTDAEERYQMYLAQLTKAKMTQESITPDEDDPRDKDGDSGSSSGRDSPKGPQPDRTSPSTQFASADLPGGMCRWKDHSTYLSEIVPGYDILGMLKAESDWNERRIGVSEAIIKDTDYLDEPTLTLGPQFQSSSRVSMDEADGVSYGVDHSVKKIVTEDLQHLGDALQETESRASNLPSEDLQSILLALTSVSGDLKKHAAEAIRLENLVLQLPSDNDAQILASHLAGIRTRIATLLAQAENGTFAIEAAHKSQIKRREQLTQYHQVLLEIELWLQTTRELLSRESQRTSIADINNEIASCEKLRQDLTAKEKDLAELAENCEQLRCYPNLRQLTEDLLGHIRATNIIFNEQRLILSNKLEILQIHLLKIQAEGQSPDLSLHDSTLDSSSMPFEEIPVLTETKVVTTTIQQQPVGVSIETQTGQSLSSPVITQQYPIDVEVQTLGERPTGKETIKISKTIVGDQETIQIDTKPVLTGDGEGDLLVEADYRTKPNMAEKPEEKTTELHILHSKTDKPFETVMVEPDETTTEVIVDADGTRRIIVKKLQRTVVSRQQTMQQQHLTTLSTLTEGDVPVSQSFSQVTLQGQQSSTTIARGDGRKETLTSQNYGGKIISSVPGGEIDVQEFQSEPEHHYTVVQGTQPPEVELQGIKLHEGDVAFVDDQNALFALDPKSEEIHTSSSTVRAVVQQVTRKIIRKTRRIIRRIVIVDGKEQVTEEIIEEPEEVEVTEEGIPRVSINVTRTQDGQIVEEQQITEPEIVDPDGNPIVDNGERYVFEQAIAQKSPALEPTTVVQSASSVVSEFIEKERSAPSVVHTRKVDSAPIADAAPAVTTPIEVSPSRTDEQPVATITPNMTSSREPTPVTSPQAPQLESLTKTVITQVVTALPGLVNLEQTKSPPETDVDVTVVAIKSSSPAPIETPIQKQESSTVHVLKPDTNTQFIVTEQQSAYRQAPNKDEITLHLAETRTEGSEPNPKHSIGEPANRELHFILAVEEKPSDSQIPGPKVAMAVQLRDTENGPVQKDIYVNLPVHQQTTKIESIVPKLKEGEEALSVTSEIDHGGTKGKKKKKRKDSSKSATPDEETRPPTAASDDKPLSVETSLAESTEIIIPDDSHESPISPKYTEEFLITTTPDDEDFSAGYEPEDKTTVDEQVDDGDDKKKKRKKRKKQKERVEESEPSAVPKSIDDSSPIGESVKFSDEEDVPYVKPEEPKKDKKRKHKQKKSESEASPASLVEAHSDELCSPNDSYKTMPTPSEAGSVKVIQEGYPTPPDSESVDSITSKIVTTVPVIEAVVTQEVTMQTSPEISEIIEDTKVIEQPKVAMQVQQTSAQTSPIETSEISLQTAEQTEEPKPETTETSSQVEIATAEYVTQTSTPEEVPSKRTTPPATEVITTETSMQTQSPVKVQMVEETAQTVTPENVEPLRSDSQMQTTEILSQEESVQTISPDVVQVQTKETSEFSTQIHPHDISKPAEEYAQTSPIPSAPPLDEVTQTSLPYETLPSRVENTSQTPPVVIKEPGETTPSSSIDEPFEVHVQAFVTLPSDADSSSPQKSEATLTMDDVSSTESDFDVEVTMDGKPITAFLDNERAHSSHKRRSKKHKKKPEQDLFAQFKRAEDADFLDPNELYSEVVKRGSRSSSPVPEEVQQIITSKIITDLDLTKLKSMEQLKPETVVKVSLTIPAEQIATPVTTFEIQPSEVLATELSIDTGMPPPKEKKPVKQKGKSKHKSSVTIEEVLSPTEFVDTPLSPTDGISETRNVWTPPVSKPKLSKERQTNVSQIPSQVNWNQIQTLERMKNLHNTQKSTHLSEVLFLASLNEPVTEESIEEKTYTVQQNLNTLKNAIRKGDVVIIQQTIVTTVETITTWLHTIEYRIYMQRQQTSDGPSREKVEEFSNLKDEIANIQSNVKELQAALADTRDIYNEDERNRMKNYVESLESQLRVIEEVTQQNEKIVADDFARWQQFINGLENISQLVHATKQQLHALIESDASPQTKLQELEELETINRSHMLKTVHLISAARGLMRDFPNREIPLEVYTMHDVTKQIDHHISVQREKALHLLALAEEYVQTLKEFAQIIEIADALVDSPISVRSLEHLEEEVQNHRKFFINLSHCRAILESLEENLDSETRALHSKLHQKLYQRASGILDKAAGRLQQMSLAASRWTVLEQGMKEEQRWLEVARGRVPDLSNVTSVDYDQYINLYQSLSMDITHHHTKLSHFNNNAHKLQELITCTNLEETYSQPLAIIMKLYEDVSGKLKRLLLFRESWTNYNYQTDKLEYWLKTTQQDLDNIEMVPNTNTPTPGHMKHFWELKAQHEVYNNTRMESANALEKSMQIIPVADEMLQRKFHSELQEHWRHVSKQINDMQTAITENISAPDVPVNEKLALLEQELDEIKSFIDGLGGVIKSEEELNLYIERLQIMQGRVDTIQNELGRLGLLSSDECEKVGGLLALSKNVEIQVAEELEGSTVLRDRLQAIQRGLARVRKNHSRLEQGLNQCESCEKLGSEVVEKAVVDCREIGEELVTLWQDLMGLRQLLHTLPMRLRVTVSPTKVEREISHLQDEHTALEKRCGQLLALLRSRLALWQRFEKQLELVQQSVQEADFMMDLLTVQGQVDYARLLKATERLEGLSGDLVSRETLLAELRSCAEPLASSCTPEVSAQVEAAVTEAVTAWEDTCTNLRELCTRYQTAADLWKQYRDASELIREWCDTQMENVNGLEPDEAAKTVKVCEDTLAAHTSRLAELRSLVSEIATAVGLDGNALLGGEVEALGRRLHDVRESLTILADVAEDQAVAKNQVQEEFVKAKNYLTSVQKSVTGIESIPDSEVEKKLETLRDHLLELSKTESRIQKMKDTSMDKSRPIRTETSILEILQLWQQVFRETFQQYHRLSTRLIKNEDSMAALKLWQEYLLHVQQFLLGSIPSEYNSLAEHQRLLEVHQNLLTTQQSVLQPLSERDNKLYEVNLLEQFNSLTNLHNETLSKIIDRHGEVSDRLNSWDRYRYDQNRLLGWLKDMEKERERLQLRYINIRRVPKVLAKIQSLLGQIPQGEDQADQLQKQQPQLLEFSDDAFGASIRMEHVAIVQRISNLQAGLDTWKQFLERINALVAVYEEKVKKIQDLFDHFQDIINSNSQESPGTHSVLTHRLETLRQIRSRLNELTKDLEQLGVTQEQLKECVSPMDMKTISQRMWLLWHQQGDIDHQLTILCHQLEEQLGLRSTFEARQSRFIIWADNLERRLEEEQEKGDPSEVLKRLETELQTEMSLKTHEYKWLINTGHELVSACGEDYSDVVAKQNLQVKTDEVRKRWERLEQLGKNRVSKIQDMTQTMLQLELKIAEIKSWLHQTEIKLSKPLVFESANKNVIDGLIQEHDVLKKSIEKESVIIGEVINLWELLLSDADVWKIYFTTETITLDIQNIEKRWKVVCGKAVERKQKLMFAWKLLLEILRICSEQEHWLIAQDDTLKELDKPVNKQSREQISDKISKLENLIKEVESRSPTFEILEQTYSKLVKTSGLDQMNIRKLTAHVRQLIIKWRDILPNAHSILQNLQRELALYKEFVAAHGNAIMGLTRVDAQLTELQHLTSPEMESSVTERLEKLEKIDQSLTAQNTTLENADKLGLLLMQRRPKPESKKIQEMIDEYQVLWRDIQERIIALKSSLKTQRREIDEGVQVDTLKFEQDTAVQVNTLPPHLQRMMSITPKDAYMVELASAIGESASNVNKLQRIVDKEIPQQGSTELHLIAKQISKLLATCQSSIELMNHLHDVLIDECDATEDEARTEEVRALAAQYTNLISKAKQKEAKIRELSEAGRLLCPLCTKRNWAQLDNDLWRLEQWLQAAEGIQSSQRSPPSNIEQLEDVIQDHREFLLDLDSHKSIIRSLNIVGTHLADHSEDAERAENLRERLDADNKRWDSVCLSAASWQTALQKALMDNRQFHAIVEELCAWLEKTEAQIKAFEPVDLTVDTESINNKFERFCLLKSELEHCEPRVVSLQENANQLLRHEQAPDGSVTICARLNELRLKLHSLIRLTRIYVLKLGAVLGRDPNELGLEFVSSSLTAGPSLQSLSYNLLDQATATPDSPSAPEDSTYTGSTDDLKINTTVLRRGYHFLGRVIRASLPIQAIMLLLLGVASLVPSTEEDYACSLVTTFANSLNPTLHYRDGPPPI